MKNLLNLLIVPIFLLCSFQKESALSPFDTLRSEKLTISSERIIYLFFKADKDRSGNEQIVLQNSKITEGKLKWTPTFDKKEARDGDYIVTVIGADGKDMAQQLIKDPLNPELEVYEKEGMNRHQASLQNAEFSVRFPYAEKMQQVKIEKLTESGAKLLFTQKL